VIAPGVRSCARDSSAIVMPACCACVRSPSSLGDHGRPAFARPLAAIAARASIAAQTTRRKSVRCAGWSLASGAPLAWIDAVAPGGKGSDQVFAFHGDLLDAKVARCGDGAPSAVRLKAARERRRLGARARRRYNLNP
jgi:hypothetical protein